MRAAIVTLSLLPYAWFGIRDNFYHFKHRNVGQLEWLLHIAIVICVFVIVPHAIAGNTKIVTAGLLLFVAARALDEFVFHRGVGAEEADIHAKTHLAFLIFVVATAAVDWLETGAA